MVITRYKNRIRMCCNVSELKNQSLYKLQHCIVLNLLKENGTVPTQNMELSFLMQNSDIVARKKTKID